MLGLMCSVIARAAAARGVTASVVGAGSSAAPSLSARSRRTAPRAAAVTLATLGTVLAMAGGAIASPTFRTSDRKHDVTWNRLNAKRPTARERARADLIGAATWMTARRVKVRWTLRGYGIPGSVGMPDHFNQRLSWEAWTPTAQSAVLIVDTIGSAGNGVLIFPSWPSGYHYYSCRRQKVAVTIHRSTVTAAVPRRCFPKGWHLSFAQWEAHYQWEAPGSGGRLGDDRTSAIGLSMVPRPR